MTTIVAYAVSQVELPAASKCVRAAVRVANATGRNFTLAAVLGVVMFIGAFTGPQTQAALIIASQDAWISELAPTANVNNLTLSVRRSSTQLNISYLKFDISTLTDDVATASLILTASKANVQFELYAYGGFEDVATWLETTLTYNNSPLQFPDGQSVSSETTATHILMDQFDLVPVLDLTNANAKVIELGSAILPAAAINTSTTFSSAALAAFINTARAGSDTTIALVLGTTNPNSDMQFHTKDAAVVDAFKPTLDVTLVPEPTAAVIATARSVGARDDPTDYTKEVIGVLSGRTAVGPNWLERKKR